MTQHPGEGPVIPDPPTAAGPAGPSDPAADTTPIPAAGPEPPEPVYGTPPPEGPAPAPPPPPPGYAAPGYTGPTSGQQPAYGQPPAYAPHYGPARSVPDERLWALLAHLGGVLAIVKVVHLLPSLLIYTVLQSRSDFVKDQAREALNFQIVVLIVYFTALILDRLPGFPNLVILVWLFSLVFSVLGAVAASKGIRYRYPLTYRFLK
jgi:uncharacterized protein